MPNVDDIGKLFESTPANLTVPNPGLKPEYAWNFEIGVIGRIPTKLRVELNAFYSILDDAITRRPFQFNGQDSVLFQGTMSKVEALQNIATATVRGIQAGLEIYFTSALTLQSNANWIGGRETDDTKNEQVALRHAPPFYGATHLRFRKNKIYADAYAMYNSEIKNEDLSPAEQAKPDIYAKDKNGKPFSPGWHTVNLKTSYQLTEKLLLTVGWENITNQRYRPYSSGIVAAGSNVIVSMRAAL
jgi:hemoglobin/transferrin/lactoferrin receptor protein